MGRIFILGVIIFNTCNLISQNLLLNGDFEETSDSNRQNNIYKYRFYFKNWHEPTDCSSDIFRDFKICDLKHVKSVEPKLNFCVDVQSGNYCAGFGLISYGGDTEYLTGKLKSSLKKDSLYKVTFWLKFAPNKSSYSSKGMGYKLSKDSIVFKSSKYALDGLQSNYNSLFNDHIIIADFFYDYPFICTTWTKVESIIKSEGGEKFITFGMFKLMNDKEIVKQFDKLKKPFTQDNLNSFLTSNKSLILEKINIPITDVFENLDENYYFLDNVSVLPLSKIELEAANKSCINCIDNDPLTLRIPNQLSFFVDKGFFGDLHIIMKVYHLLSSKVYHLKVQ